MSDSLKKLLEEKGLRTVDVDRASEGHVVRVRGERADGIEVLVLMDQPAPDATWANAVLARADPEAFMVAILADGGDSAESSC